MIKSVLQMHCRIGRNKKGKHDRYSYLDGETWFVSVETPTSLYVYRVIAYDEEGLATLKRYHRPEEDQTAGKSDQSPDTPPPHTQAV